MISWLYHDHLPDYLMAIFDPIFYYGSFCMVFSELPNMSDPNAEFMQQHKKVNMLNYFFLNLQFDLIHWTWLSRSFFACLPYLSSHDQCRLVREVAEILYLPTQIYLQILPKGPFLHPTVLSVDHLRWLVVTHKPLLIPDQLASIHIREKLLSQISSTRQKILALGAEVATLVEEAMVLQVKGQVAILRRLQRTLSMCPGTQETVIDNSNLSTVLF